MPDPVQPPNDDLERLLAAEEAAIRDDGFSERVMEKAGLRTSLRRWIIGGAGMVGAGFAVGGAVELTPYLPKLPRMTGWFEQANQVLTADNVRSAVESGGMWSVVMVVAVAGAVVSMLAVAAVQGR